MRRGLAVTDALGASAVAEPESRAAARDDADPAALRAHIAELVAANRALEAFVDAVAHDLGAPMRAIDFFAAQLAGATAGADPQAGVAASRIRAARARMGAILDAHRGLAAAHRDLARRQVDLSLMFREIARDLCAADPGRDIDWRIADGLVARCDPGLTRLVLENLAGNAFKYTRTAGRAVVGFGACAAPDGAPGFCVSDNGVGFDMRDAGRLFKPFSRLHGADAFEGSGIGLATVQRIIARHGGAVRAESASGRGARFTFTLGPSAGPSGG